MSIPSLITRRGVRRIALTALLVTGCQSTPPVLPHVQAPDLDGGPRSPTQVDGVANTLIFITNDCPIANGFAPEIKNIVREYQPRGIAFFLVHVDRDLSPEQARLHAQEYGYQCPILLDSQHELVKVVGATVTPEAAVIDAGRRLVYRGRIDDRYADFGKKRFAPAAHDLREALDAVLAGTNVANPRTRAVGCYISDSNS